MLSLSLARIFQIAKLSVYLIQYKIKVATCRNIIFDYFRLNKELEIFYIYLQASKSHTNLIPINKH